MVNTQSLLVCVIGIKELQVKGFFEVSVERQQEVFSLALSLGSWFASFG